MGKVGSAWILVWFFDQVAVSGVLDSSRGSEHPPPLLMNLLVCVSLVLAEGGWVRSFPACLAMSSRWGWLGCVNNTAACLRRHWFPFLSLKGFALGQHQHLEQCLWIALVYRRHALSYMRVYDCERLSSRVGFHQPRLGMQPSWLDLKYERQGFRTFAAVERSLLSKQSMETFVYNASGACIFSWPDLYAGPWCLATCRCSQLPTQVFPSPFAVTAANVVV